MHNSKVKSISYSRKPSIYKWLYTVFSFFKDTQKRDLEKLVKSFSFCAYCRKYIANTKYMTQGQKLQFEPIICSILLMYVGISQKMFYVGILWQSVLNFHVVYHLVAK